MTTCTFLPFHPNGSNKKATFSVKIRPFFYFLQDFPLIICYQIVWLIYFLVIFLMYKMINEPAMKNSFSSIGSFWYIIIVITISYLLAGSYYLAFPERDKLSYTTMTVVYMFMPFVSALFVNKIILKKKSIKSWALNFTPNWWYLAACMACCFSSCLSGFGSEHFMAAHIIFGRHEWFLGKNGTTTYSGSN